MLSGKIQMPEAEYRARPEVNKSTLWEMRKSPMHYKWALENPSEDTPAMKMGRMIHVMALQPEEFPNMYAVVPNGIDRRTKEGKAKWAEIEQRTAGKELCTQEEGLEAVEIAGSAVNYMKQKLVDIGDCETEVPIFWEDPRTGIYCKCRVDAMIELEDKFLIIDLKTTNDAGTDAFTRAAWNYGYHVQAAHYMNGIEANGLNHGKPMEWWFLAVEKKKPYAVNLIKAGQTFLDEGQYKLMSLMDRLEECMRTDEYPGYGVNELILPEWMAQEGDDDE